MVTAYQTMLRDFEKPRAMPSSWGSQSDRDGGQSRWCTAGRDGPAVEHAFSGGQRLRIVERTAHPSVLRPMR